MLEKLKNLIFDEYKRQEINIRTQSESVHYVSPLIELSEEQREILEKGDGQKLNEYKQINSSTGLAVNYYKLMEDLDLISELIFEKKPAIPLEKSQKFVNIDVFLYEMVLCTLLRASSLSLTITITKSSLMLILMRTDTPSRFKPFTTSGINCSYNQKIFNTMMLLSYAVICLPCTDTLTATKVQNIRESLSYSRV